MKWHFLSWRACGTWALLVSLLFLGCGGTSSPGGTTQVPTAGASSLDGNWLLAGTLPQQQIVVGTPPPFGLAIDLNVSQNRVTGFASERVNCSAGMSLSLGSISGTVASDGTFTLQSAEVINAAVPILTITGTAPATPGSGWEGSFTLTEPSGITCSTPLTGQFSAASIPLLSGTYTGTVPLMLSGIQSGSATPVSITLQQGGVPSSNSMGLFPGDLLLSGTIEFQGQGCLTSGTTAGALDPLGMPETSSVQGDSIHASFLMNDGSTLIVSGSISALDSSKISVDFFTSVGGTCPSQFTLATTLSH